MPNKFRKVNSKRRLWKQCLPVMLDNFIRELFFYHSGMRAAGRRHQKCHVPISRVPSLSYCIPHTYTYLALRR